MRAKVEEAIGPADYRPAGFPFTPRSKKVLELALREAAQLGHDYIGTEHLLLGLLREGEGVAATVLKDLGADFERVRARVVSLLANAPSSESSRDDRRSRLGAVPPRSSSWPDYPTRILSGPPVRLDADGVEFSVTGVLLYDDAAEVFWRLAGITFAPAIQHNEAVAYVTLSDDVETTYWLGTASVTGRPDGAFVGRARFIPPPPNSATRLIVVWEGKSIAVEL